MQPQGKVFEMRKLAALFALFILGFSGVAFALTANPLTPVHDCGNSTCDTVNGDDCKTCPQDCPCTHAQCCVTCPNRDNWGCSQYVNQPNLCGSSYVLLALLVLAAFAAGRK